MDATLERYEPIVAGPERPRQTASTPAEAAQAWTRFQPERDWCETPRTPVRPWRDEEGL
jgi:hypothetical protein